jgi:putative membrane protein
MSDFERQHPVAAVTRLLSTIRANLIPIVVLLFFGLRGSEDNFNLIAILIGVAFALVYGVLSWWQYKFRVVDGELQINYGVFIRKKLYLNRQRIQVIDITEGIIQRFFGLVKMEIKTAGSGTERASISAISRERALELKDLLSRDKKGLSGEAEDSSEDEKELVFRKIEGRELMIAALTSGSFGIIASIVGGVTSQLNQIINEENVDWIASHLPGFNNVMVIAGIVAVLILISWLLSFFGVLIQYTDFKIEKGDDELIISRGLFERKTVTLPYDRIQAVRIVEGVLRMPINRAMIYIESAGFQQQKSKSVVAMPLISLDEIPDFLSTFLSEYELEKVDVRPPDRAFFRYLRRPLYLPLLIITPLIFFWTAKSAWLYLICLPLIFFAYRSYQENGARIGKDVMIMINRFLNRKTILVRRPRIQAAEMSINPFQARKLLSSFDIKVASGHEGITFQLSDLDKDEAALLLKWAVPGFVTQIEKEG